MPHNSQNSITTQAMLGRIKVNLDRVQGHLAVLNQEIDDPQKLGPAASHDVWKNSTGELVASLSQLKQLLERQDWECKDG